jgi:uncharacterized protein YggE
MKTKILIVGTLMACLAHNLDAQVEGNSIYNTTPAPAAMGNYQYNVSADMANANYNYQQQPNKDRHAATNAIPNDNEFTIRVNGLMNVVASYYVAVFNVLQVGLTARATDSIMNGTIEEFKKKLFNLNIDTSDIKVDIISFVPKYNYQSRLFSRKYNEIPAGFELEKNVYVRFKKSSALDGILSAAAASEIYDLVKVDYFLPNAQKLMDSLRLRCLEELKSRTKSYQIVGFRLDTLKKALADNFITIFPQTRYYSYSAFSRPSLASLKKHQDDQPFAAETYKPLSRYYDQVAYDDYDVILNPVITEPAVQLSYTVSVKYSLKNEQPPKEKKKYFFITKDGEVKEMPLID